VSTCRVASTGACEAGLGWRGSGSYVIASGGGLVSFLSPCVLPLVPVYLSMVTGLEVAQVQGVRGFATHWTTAKGADGRGIRHRCLVLARDLGSGSTRELHDRPGGQGMLVTAFTAQAAS